MGTRILQLKQGKLDSKLENDFSLLDCLFWNPLVILESDLFCPAHPDTSRALIRGDLQKPICLLWPFHMDWALFVNSICLFGIDGSPAVE